MKFKVVLGIFLLIGLVALAAGGWVLAEEPRGSRCLPPGMTEEMLNWPITHCGSGEVSWDDGTRVAVLVVYLAKKGDQIFLVRGPRGLIVVNFSPPTAENIWVDAGLIYPERAPEIILRSVPGKRCQWVRVGSRSYLARSLANAVSGCG